ncbi:hypothetical protein MBLNU13_g09027t1 [Cladosporium sp. NU13]
MQTRSMKAKERVSSGTVLHKLPAELLGMIATQTDNKGLASMRATYRELRDGSAFEFLRRYTSLNIRLTGTQSGRFSGHYQVVDTKSPDVVSAQAMTQSLVLPESYTTLFATPQTKWILRRRVSKRDASMDISKLCNNDFELKQTSWFTPDAQSGVTALLLKHMAVLAPQTLKLRIVDLIFVDVDGDDLTNLLERQQQNFREVHLRGVVLTKGAECMAALSCTEARKLTLEDVRLRDEARNLSSLEPQSPVLLNLLRLLLERDPDWTLLEYCRGLENTFYFDLKRRT